MRWYRNNVNRLARKKGDQRCIIVYLWVPRNIDGEVRWLTRAWIRQQVCEINVGYTSTKLVWKDVKWTNENDEFLERL